MRAVLERLPGGEIIHSDLPVDDVQLTWALNAPRSLKCKIPLNAPGVDPGVLREWGAAVWVENGAGGIAGGGIITTPPDIGSDSELSLECFGMTAYLSKQPWQAPLYQGIQVDPLEMVRKIWGHLQALPGGDLGLVLDATTSPVRIGTDPKTVSFKTSAGQDVEFEAGPFKLDPLATNDLAGVVAKLAESIPFEYFEEDTWNGEKIGHRLRLGYPRLGARRHDLRLELGVNVFALPDFGPAEAAEYASAVVVWGAGEGSAMVASPILTQPSTRLRRALAVTDKKATSRALAEARARAELAARGGGEVITSLEVHEHAFAPIARLRPGDEVFVAGESQWGVFDAWVRILEIAWDPLKQKAKLSVKEA